MTQVTANISLLFTKGNHSLYHILVFDSCNFYYHRMSKAIFFHYQAEPIETNVRVPFHQIITLCLESAIN